MRQKNIISIYMILNITLKETEYVVLVFKWQAYM